MAAAISGQRSLMILGGKTCSACRNLEPDGIGSGDATTEAPARPPPVVYREGLTMAENRRYLLAVSAYAVAESAGLGDCRYCALIWNSITAYLKYHLSINGKSLSEDSILQRFANIEISIFARQGRPIYVHLPLLREEPLLGFRLSIEIFRSPDTPPAAGVESRVGLARDINGEITSGLVFSQLEKWLDSCAREHEKCPKGPTFPPRRLVDIGESSVITKEARHMRLVQDLNHRVEYIALSHCWGTQQAFTTTTSTLPARLTALNEQDLPQTYKDAIIVARRLNIRYLWIDSLCIVQDDLKDWEIESAKMASIYEDSFFTLSAAGASDDNEGFLGNGSARARLRSIVVPNFSHLRVRMIHDIRHDVYDQAITSRAWTLQERLVPQRVVTFGHIVTFECRQAEWCECGSGLFVDPFIDGAKDKSMRCEDRRLFQNCLEQVNIGSDDLYRFWLDGLVTSYTGRKITKPSDRLPAISALVEKFQLMLGDEYLAGLWKEDLICGLAWHTPTATRFNEDQSHRAPTWSWVSVEGPVEWYKRMNKPGDLRRPNLRLQILNCEVNHKGGNMLGEIAGGILDVTGLGIQCELDIWFDIHPTLGLRHRFTAKFPACGEVICDQLGFQLDTRLGVAVHTMPNGREARCLNRLPDTEGPQKKVSGEVFCMLLQQRMMLDDMNYPMHVRDFIVLGSLPAADNGEPRFQRIGFLAIYLRVRHPHYEKGGYEGWFGDLPEWRFKVV